VSKVDPVVGRLKVRGEKNGDIAEIKEVEKMLSVPMEMKCRGQNDKGKEHGIEEREDPKSTTSIKVFDFVLSLCGVVKDAGDEKTGENKEQVYSHPSGIGNETPETKSGVRSLVAAGEVIKHYGKYGDSAETPKRSMVMASARQSGGAG
jgi:hypothetical protein